MSDRLLTTREVAGLLGLSAETVLRRFRRGELPGFRLASNCLRFRESEIEAWLERARGPGARGEVSPTPSALPTRTLFSQLSPTQEGGEDAR